MKDAPVISPHETYGSVTRTITGIVLPKQRGWGWWIGFTMAGGLLSVLGASLFWLFYKGVGIWGINMPVAWGTAIINYVWWIEIAQGGTFISAVLLLFHQKWRTLSQSLYGSDDTFRARLCASLFPLVHHGPTAVRILPGAPYPNTLGMWPQFASPLVWDFFRSFDLRHDLRAVLVSGHDPRLGDDAGFDRPQVAAPDLRCRLLRLAQLGDALAPL